MKMHLNSGPIHLHWGFTACRPSVTCPSSQITRYRSQITCERCKKWLAKDDAKRRVGSVPTTDTAAIAQNGTATGL